MSKKTTPAVDSLDEQYVTVNDPNHQMNGFFGLAQYDPSTGFYDVLEEDENTFKITRSVDNLRFDQLKLVP